MFRATGYAVDDSFSESLIEPDDADTVGRYFEDLATQRDRA
jgi:hypothetical protein